MWNRDRALALLKREGRTREWLAEQCGIELPSLNHLLREKNGRDPGRPVLILMAKALNAKIEELEPNDDNTMAG